MHSKDSRGHLSHSDLVKNSFPSVGLCRYCRTLHDVSCVFSNLASPLMKTTDQLGTFSHLSAPTGNFEGLEYLHFVLQVLTLFSDPGGGVLEKLQSPEEM